MAIPLIIWAGYAISAAAVAAATAEVASGENDNFEPPEALRRLVASVINWCIGEKLVQPEDLTGRKGIDAGLVRIINGRSPIKITTLLDKEQFAKELLNGSAALVSERSGFQIRSLTDKRVIQEDLLLAGSKVIAEKTGLTLTNMLDKEAVIRDVIGFSANHLAVRSGIYLSNPLDVETVKEDLMQWGLEKGAERMVEKLQSVLAGSDRTNERIVALLRKAGIKGTRPLEMVRGANAVLLGAAGRRYQEVKRETKVDRRKKQLREAAARFRRKYQNKGDNPEFTGVRAGMIYKSVEDARAAAQARKDGAATAAAGVPAQPANPEPKKKLWDRVTGKFKGGKEAATNLTKPAVPAGIDMGRPK